jgi:hypothetical protein
MLCVRGSLNLIFAALLQTTVVAAFALADTLAVRYSLADKLLAASDATVETLDLGGG